MEKKLREMANIIRQLVIEVGDLKARVSLLEANLPHTDSPAQQRVLPRNMKLEGESYETLGGLYKEGYHICSMAFGQPREEDCLFCIAFLEKE